MGRIHRRKYLIDPSFQINYMFKFCVIVIIASLVIGGAIFLLTQNSTTVAIENTKVYAKSTADFILPNLVMTVSVVSVLAAVIVLFVALFVTHRIVGPIYRIKKEIEFMKEGDLDRSFGIRKKDQLQDLAKSLSELSGILKGKQREASSSLSTLVKFLEKRDYNVRSEDREELNKLLTDMNNAVNYFRA